VAASHPRGPTVAGILCAIGSPVAFAYDLPLLGVTSAFCVIPMTVAAALSAKCLREWRAEGYDV
jgi:hypothetical protein